MEKQEKILELTRGFEVAQCVFTATELGIPDLLKEGVKTCDELAKATNTQSDLLYRLLRVLVGIGIVDEIAPQQFSMTELTTCLQENTINSVKNFVLLRAKQDYFCWSELGYSLKTGKSAFEHLFGKNRYQYNKQNPGLSECFDKAMTELALRHDKAILSAYNFAEFNKLMDVGGGQGSLLISILKSYPHLKGILFDQPQTIKRAMSLFEQHQVSNHCEFIEGDFFQNIPQGADVYILKQVLHNWDYEKAKEILQNCRRAIHPQGRLIILEAMISDKSSLKVSLVDLRMLVSTSAGKIRSESDFDKLFQQTGFKILRIIPTDIEIFIIEAS